MAEQHISESIGQNWIWFLGLGIVLLICGTFAVVAPVASTFAIGVIIAGSLVIGGIFQLVQASRVKSWGGFLWQFVLGLVALAGGIIIYASPIAGAKALTLVLAAVFLAQGAFQLMLAYRLRPHDGWGWIAIAGLVSIAVSLAIFTGFPSSSEAMLGILAGLSIAMNGWSYVAIAMASRRQADDA